MFELKPVWVSLLASFIGKPAGYFTYRLLLKNKKWSKMPNFLA
jgi:hypothetical protein